jgi:hypothetical protein
MPSCTFIKVEPGHVEGRTESNFCKTSVEPHLIGKSRGIKHHISFDEVSLGSKIIGPVGAASDKRIDISLTRRGVVEDKVPAVQGDAAPAGGGIGIGLVAGTDYDIRAELGRLLFRRNC